MNLSQRTQDARLETAIAYEVDQLWRLEGFIEPDEPTDASHRGYMASWNRQARGEFSAAERQEIRARLGMVPFVAPPEEQHG